MKFWDVVMKMNRFWWRLCDLVSLDTLQHTQSAGLMHLYSFSFVGYSTRSTNRKTLSYCKYKNNTRTNTRTQFSTNHKCKTRDVKALHFTFVEVNFLFLLSQHCVYSLVRFRHKEKNIVLGLENITFWLKMAVLVSANTTGNVPRSLLKHPILSPQTAGNRLLNFLSF